MIVPSFGNTGDDVLNGGDGMDTADFSGTVGVTVNLNITTAQATGYGNDTLTSIENVRTGAGADTIIGDANNNVFFDGGGADTYTGNAGDDTVSYATATAGVVVNLALTTAQAASTGGDILTGIENVIGSAVADDQRIAAPSGRTRRRAAGSPGRGRPRPGDAGWRRGQRRADRR